MQRIRVFGLLTCLLFVAIPGMAQLATTTSLLGTVTDSSGAVIPNVNIVAVEVSTQDTYRAVSTDDGDYAFPYVHIGTYTVTATAKGFQTDTHTDILVETNHTVRVDFTLQVGMVTQSVTVAGTPPIQTEDATIRQTVSLTQVADLPLNGRNSLMLATTTPGVILGFKASAAADPGQDFIGAGVREVENDISMDGVSIMNNLISKGQFAPSVDAVQEVQVQTGTYPAQYGGYMGAHINLVSKSGTNQVHGSAFEFVRNDDLDARQFFESPTAPKIPFHRNQFGGEMGGPVVIPALYNGRNKTFFMMSYEGMRQIESTASVTTVMDNLMRTGNFSELTTPIHDPLLPGNPTFNQNIIPAADQSPQAMALLPFIPTPNLSGTKNNFAATTAANDSWNQTVDRVDENVGDKTRFFFRYGWLGDSPLYGSQNPFGVQPAPNHDSNWVIGYTQSLSNSMVNDFRFGRQIAIVSSTNYFFGNSALEAQAAAVGIPGFGNTVSTTNPGIASIGISGYLGTGSATPATTNDETLELNDTFNYIHGAHSIVAGFDLDRFHMTRSAVNLALGSFSFTGAISGVAPADFLLGLPLSDSTPQPP